MKTRRRHAEGGYALFAVIVVICVVTVWMTNAALATGYGVLAAAATRNRLNARIAANGRASGAVPDGTGGSVWPAAPVDGFSDVLVTDDATGRLRLVDPNEPTPQAQVILRQWRLETNAAGGRVLDVSTVIVDAATHEAVPAPSGGEFHRSAVVE